MTILDGKATAEAIKREIRAEVMDRLEKGLKAPTLAAVIVGHSGASETYVAGKVKACEACGFNSRVVRLPDDTPQEQLIGVIHDLNNDSEVDGFIVQLPLPEHISEKAVIEAISPDKDVDGFTAVNVGKLLIGEDTFVSATPAGIVELLKRNNIPTRGKHCVIISRSNIVGKPLAALMLRKGIDATVTVCHSATPDLAAITRQGDIVVAAVGKPEFVTSEMVKEGAVVIDVGITRVADVSRRSGFRICGDVLFEDVAPKADFITPVPGGVGPMTIAALMLNTLKAARR